MGDEFQADELSKARAWQRRKMLELADWQQQWTWTAKLSPQQCEAATAEAKRGDRRGNEICRTPDRVAMGFRAK